MQERIDGYKKKKKIVNKQSDDQATENESRSNVKVEVLDFNVFSENRHLHWGEVKLIAVGCFFCKKDNIYKYTTHKRFGFRMEFQNMVVNSTRLPLIR